MSEALNPRKIGSFPRCGTCGKSKAPRGRSCSMVTYPMYCHHGDCSGYYDAPEPGSLWTDETEEEFGHWVGDDGVRIMGDEEFERRQARKRAEEEE